MLIRLWCYERVAERLPPTELLDGEHYVEDQPVHAFSASWIKYEEDGEKLCSGFSREVEISICERRKKICLFLLPSCVFPFLPAYSSSSSGLRKCQRTHAALTCHSQFLFGMSGNWILSELFSNLPIFESHIGTDIPATPSCRFASRVKSVRTQTRCSCSCNLHTSSAFLDKLCETGKKWHDIMLEVWRRNFLLKTYVKLI